jgi:hypothetical protein
MRWAEAQTEVPSEGSHVEANDHHAFNILLHSSVRLVPQRLCTAPWRKPAIIEESQEPESLLI